MNKKQSIPNLQPSTKPAPRNTRALSHNSSSGSLKGKGPNSRAKISAGKENLSSNLYHQKQNQSENQLLGHVGKGGRSQDVGQVKGLKKVKNKIQNKGDALKGKKESNAMGIISKSKSKLGNFKQNEKGTSMNHHSNSSKSLLNHKSGKIFKNTIVQSEKKLNTLISQKATPKSIPKKMVTTKQITKKTQTQISLNTIINYSQPNQSHEPHQFQSYQQTSSIEATPKIDKQFSEIKAKPKTNINQLINNNLNNALNADTNTTPTPKIVQPPVPKSMMISQFKILGKISQGVFSTSFQVEHIETGFLYCLKVFEKVRIRQQGLQDQVIAELRFRLGLWNTSSSGNGGKNVNLQKLFAFFDDEVYLYFVEEYLLGFRSIEKEIIAKRKLSEKQSALIFKQVLQIVRYIHSQNYIHRDIRIQNLARCFGIVKLIDFSWVACIRHKKQRDTFCGTYKHAPPQLLLDQTYNQSIDTWSLGLLLYELTTGQSPFPDTGATNTRNSHSMNFPIFLSNQLVDLIGRLLSDKGTRIRIEEILMHEWANRWDGDGFVSKEIWDFWVL